MTNNEMLNFYEEQLNRSINFKESLEQAAIMIKSKARILSDSLLQASDEFRREAEDYRFQIEELKKHLKDG